MSGLLLGPRLLAELPAISARDEIPRISDHAARIPRISLRSNPDYDYHLAAAISGSSSSTPTGVAMGAGRTAVRARAVQGPRSIARVRARGRGLRPSRIAHPCASPRRI